MFSSHCSSFLKLDWKLDLRKIKLYNENVVNCQLLWNTRLWWKFHHKYEIIFLMQYFDCSCLKDDILLMKLVILCNIPTIFIQPATLCQQKQRKSKKYFSQFQIWHKDGVSGWNVFHHFWNCTILRLHKTLTMKDVELSTAVINESKLQGVVTPMILFISVFQPVIRHQNVIIHVLPTKTTEFD